MPAAAVFAILLMLVTLVSGVTVYSGSKSGEFEKRIVEPLKNAVTNFGKQMTASQNSNFSSTDYSNNTTFSNNSVTVGSDINVEINNSTGSAKRTQPTYQNNQVPTTNTDAPPTYTPPIYDDSAYKKAVADQQAWYQQQVDAMNKATQERNQQNAAAADQWYQQQIQQAQQAQQQWLKDHGF